MAIRWICSVRDWPIAILELPPNVDVRKIDRFSFFEAIEALLARGERFALMADMRFAGPTDAVRRRQFTEWLSKHKTAVTQHLAGYAVIVESKEQEGMVTALRWVNGMPVPLQVFADQDSARAWLKEKMSASK